VRGYKTFNDVWVAAVNECSGNLGMRLHVNVDVKPKHSVNSLWSGEHNLTGNTCKYQKQKNAHSH